MVANQIIDNDDNFGNILNLNKDIHFSKTDNKTLTQAESSPERPRGCDAREAPTNP